MINESELINTYKATPVPGIAKIIGNNLVSFSGCKEFAILEKKELFDIFDSCKYIDPEDVVKIYKNISKYRSLDIKEVLAHLKTDKGRVSDILSDRMTDNVSNSNVDINPNGLNLSIIQQHSNRIIEIEKSLSELLVKFNNFEISASNHFNNSRIHSDGSAIDRSYEEELNNVNVSLENQQKAIRKINSTISSDINRRLESLTKNNIELNQKIIDIRAQIFDNQEKISKLNSSHEVFKSTIKDEISYDFTERCESMIKQINDLRESYANNNNSTIISFDGLMEQLSDLKGRLCTEVKSEIMNYIPNYLSSLDIPGERNDIFVCCKKGDLAALEKMILANPCSIDEKDPNMDFNTLLHIAVENDHVDICRFLLSKNANVSERNKRGCTPLHICCNIAIAELLMFSGADKDARDALGNTPLIYAATSNRVDVCQFLIKSGANPNLSNKEGWSALHSAARWNYKDIVMCLCSNNADPNIKDNEGYKPLFYASINSDESLVNMLRSFGAQD